MILKSVIPAETILAYTETDLVRIRVNSCIVR